MNVLENKEDIDMLRKNFMSAFGCEERLLEPLYGDEFYDDDDNKLEKVYEYLEEINDTCYDETDRYPTLEEWLLHIECEEFEDKFGSLKNDYKFRSDVLAIIEELMYLNSVNTYRKTIKKNR